VLGRLNLEGRQDPDLLQKGSLIPTLIYFFG
jgi:hypothetical protein